jgi:iron complex transport system substrate-binding protein
MLPRDGQPMSASRCPFNESCSRFHDETGTPLRKVMVLQRRLIICCFAVIMLVCLIRINPIQAWPVHGTDSPGRPYEIDQRPQRVVSLVPEIDEILFAIGAGNAVVGITRHTVPPPSAANTMVVGGFRTPDIKAIEALRPDLIIAADLQHAVQVHFQGKCTLLTLNVTGIDSAMERIELLGRIFGHEEQAHRIVTENRAQLALIARKTAEIPVVERQRVVRIMDDTKLMVPGDDSFQNDFVRAAGGITPTFGRNGQIIAVSTKEWQNFNPQVVYSCGDTRPEILDTDGVKEVAAVHEGRYFFCPCKFTCRAGIHIGDFVSWLAATIYSKEFSDPAQQVQPDRVLSEKAVAVDLPYVRRARIVTSSIRDFTNRTLLVDFTVPQTILSSLEGRRKKIKTVGNHFFPPPSWGLGHGLDDLRRLTSATLAQSPKNTSLLFTGADMNNLAVSRQNFKKMTVYALVTAGVTSNAVRMARDTGKYYEPGTINILLLTNMHLSGRAMTRAIIIATEGKTAALEDLDIRSSYSPDLAATGTGTDEVLVVQGEGFPIDNAGGHSKMGELIAKAVYEGVTEAIARQNGITRDRSVFTRLDERHINLSRVLADGEGNCDGLDRAALPAEVEKLLVDPQYAGFMTSAFAISDAQQRGLITDLHAFDEWGKTISRSIAHSTEVKRQYRLPEGRVPPVLTIAFESLINGACAAHNHPVNP